MMDSWDAGARRRSGRASAEGGSARRPAVPAELDSMDVALRRRPGAQPFGARLETTRDSLGIGDGDETYIEASRSLVAAHIDDIAAEVYWHIRSRAELVTQFADSRGRVDHERLAAHREDVRDWLLSVVNDPLDADTGEYLANLGHAHVRPRSGAESPMKARYLVDMVTRVQALLIGILAKAYLDPDELARCAAAWSRRLMAHLDVLLAVYSATQGTPHWY